MLELPKWLLLLLEKRPIVAGENHKHFRRRERLCADGGCVWSDVNEDCGEGRTHMGSSHKDLSYALSSNTEEIRDNKRDERGMKKTR
jgi:hypothetical protein